MFTEACNFMWSQATYTTLIYNSWPSCINHQSMLWIQAAVYHCAWHSDYLPPLSTPLAALIFPFSLECHMPYFPVCLLPMCIIGILYFPIYRILDTRILGYTETSPHCQVSLLRHSFSFIWKTSYQSLLSHLSRSMPNSRHEDILLHFYMFYSSCWFYLKN